MNYALQYTNRKRTISISVTPKMEVVVKAPKRVYKKEIDSFVLQKTNWITADTDVNKSLMSIVGASGKILFASNVNHGALTYK